MTVSDIARICHEANRAYCLSIGDDTQLTWEDAPEWQKTSAKNGVYAILSGTVQQPEDAHNAWLFEKERAGWVYGDTKDPEKKTHPCMVPYSHLPSEQRRKDALFLSIVQVCRG